MTAHDPGDAAGHHSIAARQRWMSVLARSRYEDLADNWSALSLMPEYRVLRGPEPGLVMTRGRIGGTGNPFNLGEMTVTRCSVQLGNGLIGHAYVPGRSKPHALTAALIDALMQGADADHLEAVLIAPLAAILQAERDKGARKAAATKVDFFTMARTTTPK